MRFARNRIHRLIAAAALVCGLAHPAVPAPSAKDHALTLTEARAWAAASLQHGDTGLAIRIAQGLLQADPHDAMAHYVIASSQARAGQDRAGRRAAALAYRYSSPGPDRMQSAQLAARLAFAEGRYSLAQLWLRRTAIHVETEDDRQRVARDYRLLRQVNPWAMRLQIDLSPSNNVNNGADTALQIIDGVPVTGRLSGEAQALSGLIASADLGISYRLRSNRQSATTLASRLYLQRVTLSAEAQEQAPRLSGSDFDSTFAEASLSHGITVNSDAAEGVMVIGAAGGESWWAGYRSYRFGRVRLDRDWLFASGRWLKTNATFEQRFKARYANNDARILGFGAQIGQVLGNGDRIDLTLALRDADAAIANGTYRSASLRISYAFDQRIGPVRLGAGLTLGYSDYPAYLSGLFWVPGGRQDKSAYGDVRLFFDQIDYAGFAPVLRLRGGRKSSNDSRFDTREVSVSLGIESKF